MRSSSQSYEAMTIPIEFTVTGRPSSVNGKTAKKRVWKRNVAAEANAKLVANFPMGAPAPHKGEVVAKFFFFPTNTKYTDIDNSLKHTIDAMCHDPKALPCPLPAPAGTPAPLFASILANDKSVRHVTAERFLPTPGAGLVVSAAAAPALAKALLIANGLTAAGVPAVPAYATAIKLEAYIATGGANW
jgi:hypothetical protein